MHPRDKSRIILAILLPLAAGVFATGINWGLPSRKVDPFLFGNQTPWTGAVINQLAPPRSGESSLGADVDPNAVSAADGAVWLNETDAQRAEIVRRYRLFTYQPDEMITLMALAQMKPSAGQLDPKLYQYGGLWIYPVGAMLKAAVMTGWIRVESSTDYYLDHPEEFGKFYVVARLYCAIWGMIGVWAAFQLIRASRGGLFAATVGSLVFLMLPVVVNLSHEAKPHLPGAVLILLASLAGQKYSETRKTGWWIAAATLCGMAAGMILSAAVALALPIGLALLTKEISRGTKTRLVLGSIAVVVCIYFLGNPYVLVHLFGDRAVLKSNLGNSAEMYGISGVWDGFRNAIALIGAGATPIVAALGAMSALFLLRAKHAAETVGLRLLIGVSSIILLQFILLAGGKPAEYARFAVLVDVTLALCAVVLIGRSKASAGRGVMLIVLLGSAGVFGANYLRGFVRDTRVETNRIEHARALHSMRLRGATVLGVYDDPAPYLLPPVDLFEWTIVKIPKSIPPTDAPVDVLLRPIDRAAGERVASPMSWADKSIEVLAQRHYFEP